MAEGYVINIPESVLKRLEKTDEYINKLGESSERTQKRVEDAFQKMANSVIPFLNNLKAIQSTAKNININSSFRNMQSAAEKTADSVAQVAVQLNKVGESPIDAVNRKIEEMRARITAASEVSQRLAAGLAQEQFSRETLSAGNQTNAELPGLQNQLRALQLERAELKQNEESWRNYLAQLNGVSLSAQKQQAEMGRLNSTFRDGSSELQKRAKQLDTIAKEEEKAAAAARKNAAAQDKKNQSAANKAVAQADREAAQAMAAYNRAMAASEGTIAQRINKMAKLRSAEEQLIATGRDYTQQIQRIAQETRRLNQDNENASNSQKKLQQTQSRTLDTSAQLQRQLALVFSVASIERYIGEMIKVRGEFELQQRALQSILQNKEKANEIWDQTLKMAVQSPFSVKDLVTFTKQLAAYRIESNKLFDTTKMLADVSAGLGVDMGRLILAFGQVKAANYLRASEVRQFTEVGVNMLGELADMYSELEGKMISVGEVQERITKRMVSFGDVEEVFKRITSAGGLFYNMQEIQAKTLSGQITNLKDAIEVMYNEIGQENDGALKGTVQLLREMVKSWRTIADIAVPIITAIAMRWALINAAALLTGKHASALVISLKYVHAQITKNTTAMTALKKSAEGMKGAGAFGGWVTVLSIVVGLIYEIYNQIQAATRAQRELNKIAQEAYFDATKSIDNYKKLADIVRDASKSYKEQQDALDELKRTYRDILPDYMLQVEYIKKIADNYGEAEWAIKSYYNTLSKQKQISKIVENYSEKISDKMISIADIAADKFKKLNINVDTSDITKSLNNIAKDIRTGEIKNQTEAIVRFYKDMETSIGRSLSNAEKATITSTDGIIFNLRLLTNYLIQETESLKRVQGFEVFGDILSPDEKEVQERAKNLVKIRERAFEALSNVVNNGKNGLFLSPEQLEQEYKAVVDAYNIAGKDLLNLKKKWQSLLSGNTWVIQDIKTEISESVNQGLEKTGAVLGTRASKIMTDLKSKTLTPLQQWSIDFTTKYANSYNIALSGLEKFLAQAEDNTKDFYKRLKEERDSLAQTIANYSNPDSMDSLNSTAEEKKRNIEILGYLNAILATQVNIKTQGKDRNQQLRDQISLIKSIGKAYKDNLRYYNKEEAYLKTKKDFLDAFKEAGLSNILEGAKFDPEGIIDMFEKLKDKLPAQLRRALEKSIAEYRGQIDLEVRVNNIEKVEKSISKVFDNYQAWLDLDKMGIDKYLAADALKIKPLSFEDMRKQVRSMFPEDESKMSQEQLKLFKETMEKIDKMELQSLDNRRKEYYKYLNDTMSKRLQIKMEELNKLKNIPEDFTDEQKEAARANITADTEQKLAKQAFEDFKNSDEYIQLFEDIDHASNAALNRMADKLSTIRDMMQAAGLSTQDLKTAMDALNKVEDEQLDRNPYNNLIGNIRRYIQLLKNRKDLEKKINDAREAEDKTSSTIKTLEDELITRTKAYNIAVKTYGADSEQAKTAQAKVKATQEDINKNTQLLAKQRQSTKELTDQEEEAEKLAKILERAANKFAQRMQEASSMLGDIQSAFGGMISGKANDALSSAQDILGGIGGMASGVGKIMSGDWIGGAMSTIGSLAKTIGGIFGINDKKKERQIQNEIKLVGRLEHAYKRLEQSIDDAYSLDTVNASIANAEKNIKERIESTQRMIEAEQGKKDSDDARIEEWKQNIDDLEDQLKELQAQKIQSLGGFGDGAAIASAAQEFASAWMEAYQETGNGLDALNGKWDEYIQNVVAKQLALRATQNFLEPIMRQLDESIGNDSYLSTEELAALKEQIAKTMPALNDAFQNMYDSFGDMLPKPGTGGETDTLSKSIQGVTESTAEILAGYLDSVRLFVADSNVKITQLAVLASSDPKSNPLLNELMNQTRLVSSINDLLGSVFRSGHSLGGGGLKVFMD